MRDERLRPLARLAYPSTAVAVVWASVVAIASNDLAADTMGSGPEALRAMAMRAVVLLAHAIVFGGFVALVAWTIDRAMRATIGRGLALAGVLALGPSAYVARGLVDGEGVEDFGVPVPLAALVATLALTGLGIFIAWLAVAARTRRVLLARALLAPIVAVLFQLASIAARSYGPVSMLAFGYACVGATAALAGVLRSLPRAGPWIAVALTAKITFFVVGGLVMLARGPLPLAVVRHDTLGASPIVLRLDAMFGRDEHARRAARFDVSSFREADCARQGNPGPTLARPSAPGARPRNVLLVSIDALRREMVGRVEAGQPVAPRLDALVRESPGPEEAYSNYAATFFSVGSALTGLSASQTLLTPEPPRGLLAHLGTHIDHVAAVLPNTPFFRRPAFARYVVQGVPLETPGDAEAEADAVIELVRRARRDHGSFAAWVHFGEPHAPYEAHPHFDFGGNDVQRYFGEVAAADAALGRLFDTLLAGGALDETLVVVFSDHGEALGERDHFGHHVFLNRWIVEVPLIVRVPPTMRGESGFMVGRGVAEVADIAPTVYSFLGIAPPHRTSGRSLLTPPGTRPSSTEPRLERGIVSEAFSTGGPWLAEFSATKIHDRHELERRVELVNDGFGRYPPSVALTRGRYRLIVGRATGFVELYDWVADPAERHDLGHERRELRDRMLAELARWHRSESRRAYCAFARGHALAPPR